MDTHEKQHPDLENNITPQASKTVQSDRQKFFRQAIAVSFVVQAALISVRGNLDVLSGKSALDVIPWMITQSIELILKAHRVEKSLKESKSKQQSTYPAN
jgi:hypothetical protein